jgi:hypothetical protein
MKIKLHTVAEWDFSLWFALLSPLIGVLLGRSRSIHSLSLKGDKNEDEKF